MSEEERRRLEAQLWKIADEDERGSWTHRLANPVLLHVDKNPTARNVDFTAKKDVYFKGKGEEQFRHLCLSRRSEKDWTSSGFEKESRTSCERVQKHWSLVVDNDKASDVTVG